MVRPIVLIVFVFLGACERPRASRTAPEQVVLELGARMKNVPTTASPDVVEKAIREQYAGLVDPKLLDAWTNSPADAPGRPVSSPWPDRIEVTSSSGSAEEATVDGAIVEVTSTGEARRVPIRVRLRESDGAWLITEFRGAGHWPAVTPAASRRVGAGAPPAERQAGGPPHDDAQSAVAVIREYYDAISARDYAHAFALWGGSGPPGQTFEDFSAGFADTASVRVETGTPSRVDAAAGSRYVEVPVTIVAVGEAGATTRFEGTYVLRRSVIEGGEKSWHLYRASIRKR